MKSFYVVAGRIFCCMYGIFPVGRLFLDKKCHLSSQYYDGLNIGEYIMCGPWNTHTYVIMSSFVFLFASLFCCFAVSSHMCCIKLLFVVVLSTYFFSFCFFSCYLIQIFIITSFLCFSFYNI